MKLKEVVRDMRRNGFGVPVLVGRLLIGTGEEKLGEECLQEGQAWLKVRKTKSSDVAHKKLKQGKISFVLLSTSPREIVEWI